MAFGAPTAVADGLKMTWTLEQILFSRYRSFGAKATAILPSAKVFAQPFSKGWRVWAEPSVLFDKSKFEIALFPVAGKG